MPFDKKVEAKGDHDHLIAPCMPPEARVAWIGVVRDLHFVSAACAARTKHIVRMQVVIVGAGASGLLHALSFRACGVSVAAVFDPDVERARALVDLCGGRVLSAFDEAVRTDTALAAVCSPPPFHVAQAEALVRASGRTVFVEKPVATSEGELERLRKLERCVPVLQWRAGRGLRALRRAIAHGELGAAPALSADLSWGRDDDYFRSRGDAWGAGALLSIGIHAVDAIAWALGKKIEGVCGMLNDRRGAGGETSAVALFRFSGGAIASLRISLDGGADVTRIVGCGRGVTAVCEGGEADPTANALRWSALDHRARDRLEALERDTAGASGAPLLVPYLAGAVDALRQGIMPGECERLPSVADVVDAHAAILGIYAFASVSRAA
jgi:predicted dehydrogenase